MELEAAQAMGKLIGAGIACIGMGGAGVGVGVIFGNYLAGAAHADTGNARTDQLAHGLRCFEFHA